jgi:large subunit ribosomal protein L17
MRHRNKVKKLQRDASHRRALLSNLVCSLITHKQIRTTLAKAKAVRPLAEKMVTLGKRGDLHARRQAVAVLRQKSAVSELFAAIAPAASERRGGYTRITKLGPRPSDSAPMAFIEWVDQPSKARTEPDAEETEGKAAGRKSKKSAKKGDKATGAKSKSESKSGPKSGE